MSDSYKLAVIGQPISHSKSPQIHRAFGVELGIELSYERFEVAPAQFDAFVSDFFSSGGHGLNVTLPLKELACQYVSSRTDRARAAGAVNTLSRQQFQGGDFVIHGDITDGIGLLRDVQNNLGIDVDGKSILVLGAGGAVRGVMTALLGRRIDEICVVNRTLSKAEKMLAELSAVYTDSQANLTACDFASVGAKPFDIILNGTSLGLSDEVPPIPAVCVADADLAYDLFYSDKDTAFVRWARDNGANLAADGLGMLVEQAAESFYLWTGWRPSTQAVIRSLRAA